jgi:Holliday junction resolvase RusA-like endonuclease
MTRYEVSFSLPWVHGWQRAGTNYETRTHFTQERTRNDEDEVGIGYRNASNRAYGRVVRAPKGVPVHVKIDLYKTEPQRRPDYLPDYVDGVPFVVKPDIDNNKHLLDGLNKVAWYDDAQVVTEFVRKHDREGVTDDRTDVTVVFELEE